MERFDFLGEKNRGDRFFLFENFVNILIILIICYILIFISCFISCNFEFIIEIKNIIAILKIISLLKHKVYDISLGHT